MAGVEAMVLVDTDVLIDVLRNDQMAVDFIDRLEHEGCVGLSLISELELLAGCRDKREQAVTAQFIRRFEWIGLAQDTGATASRLFRAYRLSHGLMIPDCLIAATALSLDIPLVTRNRRDFRFIEGLKLRHYPDEQRTD